MTGGMLASENTTPRLGIDLVGGTSITLKARADQGSAINKTNMDTAVDIMNRRVNGLGVSEAEVQTQGTDHIIVNIPKGMNSKEARQQVGTTAKLYFRPVLTSEPSSSSVRPSPSASPRGGASPKGGRGTSVGASSSHKASSSSSPAASVTARDRGPGASDRNSSKPSATDSTPAGGSITADEMRTRYAALDCSRSAERAKAGKNAKPGEPALACGEINKVWYKYLLGPAAIDGTEVKKAQAVYDTQGAAGWQVQMNFTSSGSQKFADITGELATKQQPQNQFGIVLDGQVVSSPYVQAPITGGQAEISGSFTQQEALNLANMLSYGALPLSFKEETVTTVTAALGGEQLHAGLLAGAIGFALVVIYLLVYYRGLSIVALASLAVSAILTYAIMSLLGPAIGFALNLPAVCGAIVAIGITADSFIVYFERIRDEIREGRSLYPAIERAWPRARRTILVSDFVSFLAAAVLFTVTVGKVKGFAFTLGLTTLLDVVVVFCFTKPLMTRLARRPFFAHGHKWSGLDPKSLGAEPPLRRSGRRGGRRRDEQRSRAGGLGARLHRGEISYDFVGNRKIWYGLSALITLTAIVGLAVRGLNMGIEFQGGAVFTTPAKMSTSVAKAEEYAHDASGHEAIVQKLGNGSLRIQIAGIDTGASDQIKQELAKDLNLNPERLAADLVGPSWGEEIANKAWQGLGIFMVLVVIYLAIAFEWRMAVAALVALIHDITITIGVYALVGFEATPGTVIGLLTILGYSLYDTVVVFDSLKEQTKDIAGQTRFTYSEIANQSINSTLVRSINTTVVALLPVAGLLFIGGGFLGTGTLKDISLSLFVGLAAGAYSSIFIATPIVADLKEREPAMQALKRRVLAKRAQAATKANLGQTRSRPGRRTDGAAPALAGVRNQPSTRIQDRGRASRKHR
jgi:preprotein translocase subunit SecD